MTSMFDQYEKASSKSKNNNISTAEMNSLGYINMSLEQEIPIFAKVKIEFTPSHKFTHIVIENRYLVAALVNGSILRINLEDTAVRDEISLSKFINTHKVINLFLDPTGNHILIALAAKSSEVGAELLYLSRKSTKLKVTAKFRGHEITKVAWNNLNSSENTTGPILLGTSKGLIFETEIVLDGDKFFASGFSSIEQYWRQLPSYIPLYGNREIEGLVFDIGKGTNTPITGLNYFEIPDTKRIIIFVATATRLYYFTGKAELEDKPVLQQIFSRYLNVPESDTYIEIESNLRYSKLKFYSENLIVPNSYVWMTEKGIRYGKLTCSPSETLQTITNNSKLIPFPKPLYEDFSTSLKYPTAIAVTEFHALLAYSDVIKGICLLNEEIVYEDNYNEPFSLTRDSRYGEIWSVSETAVYEIRVTQEERNVWQIFAENQAFELAKKYSRNNEACYNQVLIKEAEMLFDKKDYMSSAQCYAETRCGFEEICLKFMQINEKEALKVFLRKKLDSLKPSDQTQITMIVIWLIELYLDELEVRRLRGQNETDEYDRIQKEFETFLAFSEVSKCVRNNKSTIYELIASHGDKNNLMKLTILNKDFEKLIRQHIYKNNFFEALDVLKSQNNYDLYYQFVPILLREVPKVTVKALIGCGRKLSPVRLLPALVSCEGETASKEIIEYLEFCIEKLKNTDKCLHNLLVSLYANFNPSKLLTYLESQKDDLSLVNYDVHFALRLCQEKDLIKACVHLSSLLSMWEQAVDLALRINTELAKEIANKSPEEDTELRKKLWLKIAQHVVKGKDDIHKALEFLKECELIQIEDILPFFSDFVTIEHFKEAISNSLKEYNQRIQDLKEEMTEATKSAELVREDIQSFRNHYTYIQSTEACDICNVMILLRPFYIFPCLHKFHMDCLREELEPLLGPGTRNKLYELDKRLISLTNQSKSDSGSTGSAGLSNIDVCKSEIDNILASECLYCGENMIKNIDKPFVDDLQYEKIKKEWE